MSRYSKIVVAIDLSSESTIILKRALDVAATESEIHLVYVQEPMDSVYMGVVPYGPVFVGMDEVEENLRAELTQKLDGIGDEFNIAADSRHFLNGTPAREIRHFAEENGMDLIVRKKNQVGSQNSRDRSRRAERGDSTVRVEG